MLLPYLCFLWDKSWLLMLVTLLSGASNPEVANNHNNLGTVCMCMGEPMACMYGLSFFQLLELWLNVHFQQSAWSENYWAPLGFTHSLTLISFLRSDEKWGRSWVGLTKEVRVESIVLSTATLDIVKEFPASIHQQQQDSSDPFQANQHDWYFFSPSYKGIASLMSKDNSHDSKIIVIDYRLLWQFLCRGD